MSTQGNKLGDEFAHPTDGRPVRVVRMSREVWAGVPRECDHCCVLRECHAGFGGGFRACGGGARDFVVYVDDIPLLTVKGILA